MKPNRKRKRNATERRRKRLRKRAVAAGRAGQRGPERSVTMAVVGRVGRRVAEGMPLEYALALETKEVTLDCWHKALKADPKLSTHWLKFHAIYIGAACRQLREGDNSDVRWILTRRYPKLFALATEQGATDEAAADTAAAGLQTLLNRSRELIRLKELAAEQAG